MKSKIILIVFFSFKLLAQNGKIDTEKFDKYLPYNFEINIIVSGKFDADTLEDYLLILNSLDENKTTLLENRDKLSKRKVIILKGITSNKYQIIYDNDNLVPCREFSGKSDFSYDNLSLKNNVFTYSSPRSEFGQDYFKLLTYKLKFENNNFKLIEYQETYSSSPEDDDEILIHLNNEDIIGKSSNPFNFYNWDWCKKDNLKLTKTNVTKFNDIAYTLYKVKNYHDSVSVLENIILQFPTRVVAYLNIADCYWEMKDKPKAIENYKKYIQLMTEQKKDLNKIPKYVYERVK
jgi:tetratricopeptide (TPR) repeat protein